MCSTGRRTRHARRVRSPFKTALANFPQRGYPQDMNLKLAAVTLVALVWSSLAFCGEIHDAAKAGDLAKVKALLNANPDLISSKDTNGLTPLHDATWNGHKDVAEFLLANKADVNAKDTDGSTPLLKVAFMGHKDMADLLLANKANVNAKANNNWAPLHEAAFGGNKDVAELLLTNKADVNAKNNKGQTPLSVAVLNKHNEVAELIRQHGGHE